MRRVMKGPTRNAPCDEGSHQKCVRTSRLPPSALLLAFLPSCLLALLLASLPQSWPPDSPRNSSWSKHSIHECTIGSDYRWVIQMGEGHTLRCSPADRCPGWPRSPPAAPPCHAAPHHAQRPCTICIGPAQRRAVRARICFLIASWHMWAGQAPPTFAICRCTAVTDKCA